MSGPKRNSDRLNTIGIVVVGICGAVLVYVSIVALQAFYMGDSSEVQTMADYGGQDATFKSLRSAQIASITELKPNEDKAKQTYRIPIDHAMRLTLQAAKQGATENLVPAVGPATKATLDVPPVGPDGRLQRPSVAPSAAGTGAGAGSAAAPGGTPSNAGSGQGAGVEGAGSGAPGTANPTGTAQPTGQVPNPGAQKVEPTATGNLGPGGGAAPQQAEKLAPPTGQGSQRPIEPKGATKTDNKNTTRGGSAAKGSGR